MIVTETKADYKLYLDGKVECEGEILTCRYSKEKTLVMCGCSDGSLRTVDSVRMVPGQSYEGEVAPDQAPAPLTGIAVSPFSHLYIAVYTDGSIKFWNIKKQLKCVRTIQQQSQILGVHASPLIKSFITCGEDSVLRLYDVETGNLIRDFEASFKNEVSDGHKSRVFAVKFHPTDEQGLVSAGWDSVVHIWDLRENHSVRQLVGPFICGDGLDFSPDGTKLLTCSYEMEKNTLLWDYSEGKILADLTQDPSKVYSGKFIDPDLIMTTSTAPSTLRIISVNPDPGLTVSMYRSSLPGMYCADAQVVLGQDMSLNMSLVTGVGRSLLKLKANYKK